MNGDHDNLNYGLNDDHDGPNYGHDGPNDDHDPMEQTCDPDVDLCVDRKRGNNDENDDFFHRDNLRDDFHDDDCNAD